MHSEHDSIRGMCDTCSLTREPLHCCYCLRPADVWLLRHAQHLWLLAEGLGDWTQPLHQPVQQVGAQMAAQRLSPVLCFKPSWRLFGDT